MAVPDTPPQAGFAVRPVDIPSLERSLRKPRSLFSLAMSTLTALATVAALLPLFSVLVMLIEKGQRR